MSANSDWCSNTACAATSADCILTARDDEVDKIVGLEVGANNYITKPFSPREVIARLKAIWRRQQMSQTDLQPTHPATPNAPVTHTSKSIKFSHFSHNTQ